jgi:hypothetical protein
MKKLLVIGAAVAAASSQAQVVLSGPGTYFQNFDSLAPTGTAWSWNDNLPTALMQGWYSNQISYDADDGTNGSSGLYSYGNGSSTERALGSVALPGALIRYGIRLNNASGGTFSALNLDYIGEQWRSGSANFTDKLIFEYSTNATNLSSGTWISLTALDFNSPNNLGTGVLNGNAPANQAFHSGTMSGLTWLNGTDMWVRWTHVGNPSRDALALDTMHLNAVPAPEPMSLTVIGAACAGLVARRRRAKAK